MVIERERAFFVPVAYEIEIPLPHPLIDYTRHQEMQFPH